MNRTKLSDYFSVVGAKYLAAGEVDPKRSRQHEFNGVSSLRKILGESDEGEIYHSRFVYLSDTSEYPVIEDVDLKWYDSRKNKPHRSAEWRLYYKRNQAIEQAREGDLLVIVRLQNGRLLVIIADRNSSAASQLLKIFNITDLASRFIIEEQKQITGDMNLVAQLLFENLGVTVEITDASYLETMLREFQGTFPPTKTFSRFARSTVHGVDSRDDPDSALLIWMEQEEKLFRTLERHIVSERLKRGFGEDVDEFISYSLSVQNRRKSRVGRALENHTRFVLDEWKLRYSAQSVTENNSKPDFLFPGTREYYDHDFPSERLTMLAVKSTLKERWAQVLDEADRIPEKHLLTLEPSISSNQTDKMRERRLFLVLPTGIHQSFGVLQQRWLLSVRDFLDMVLERQDYGVSPAPELPRG